MKLVTTSQEYMDPAMNETRGNHKISANHVSPAPGEVEIVQPRQGIWRTYDVTDGLPTGIQRGLQDPRGYLWLTSWIEPVACRYDGAEFTMYTTDDGLANGGVASVLGDSQGSLWFGMDCGGVFCFDGQRFINYTTEDGLLDNRVWGIIQDREGHFWICHHQSGLTYLDLETLQTLTTEPVTDALIQDSEGRLWFGSENALCCLFQGQQRRRAFGSLVSPLMQDSTGAY